MEGLQQHPMGISRKTTPNRKGETPHRSRESSLLEKRLAHGPLTPVQVTHATGSTKSKFGSTVGNGLRPDHRDH